MTPLLAVVAILALFVGGVALVARVDGLAFLAPKSSAVLRGPVGEFCRGSCRTAQGVCPLSGSASPALNCPLWKFVETDVPTVLHGSPFAALAK
jgi:hypothetical protein